MFDGQNRFLDGSEPLNSDKHANRIQFTSFPRSGNSFLRRLIESVSGVTTGSSIPLIVDLALQIQGSKGEGYINDQVWIVKTHHPMLMPFNSTFCANKTIVVVRNPLDAFDSFANLANTMSHGVKTNYEYYEEYPEWWAWWVKT